MEIRFLGPFEVWSDDGRPAPLRCRERQFLSVLLLMHGRCCPQELLARALWPGGGLLDPGRALRMSRSRARAALAVAGIPDFVDTADGGYRACPPPGSLDLDRFGTLEAAGREASAAGDPETAARHWRAALACWRDPGLTDFPAGVAVEARKLAARRRDARSELADAELRLGMSDMIMPDLEARVVAEPACCRAWEQLITALSQSGRPAEAIMACDRARAALAGARSRPSARMEEMLGILLAGGEVPVPPPGAAAG